MAKQQSTVEKEVLSSAMAFSQAAASLTNAISSVQGLENRVLVAEEKFNQKQKELSELEEEFKAKIDTLASTFSEKERTGKVDTDLRLKEYGIEEATKILSKTHKCVPLAEYTALTLSVSEAKNNTAKEVAIAVAAADSKHKAEISELKSAHSVEQSDNKAKITALTSEISFLTKSISTLERMIDAEREASIQRAKASSVGTITVNPGK